MQQSMETATVDQAPGPYAYDYDAVSPLAMQKGLPREELPSHAWMREVLTVVMAVAHNQHEANIERADIAALNAQRANPSADEFMTLIRSLWRRLTTTSPTGRPQSVDDYRAQFRTIPLPPPANLLHDDDAFAWWRVRGTNPTAIRQAIDPGPLTSEGIRSVSAFVDDDLDALVTSGRLVVADYRETLADLEPSSYPGGPKYAYRPVAWFGVPKGSRRLTPIAILPDEDGSLQYAPPAGKSS